jgi:SAM-dependent methyltransferase
MAESTNGIWRLFSTSFVYEASQYISGSKRIQKQLIDTIIIPKVGDHVLDIGCGTGEILRFLPAVHYVGFDHSKPYIETAQAKYGKRATFFCDDVANFKNHTSVEFDLVLSLGVLHHLDDSQVLNLLNVADKALKPGGRFVAVEPVYFNGQGYIDRFLTGLDRGHNVRTEHAYETLLKTKFSIVRRSFFKGALPLPRSGVVFVCLKDNSV